MPDVTGVLLDHVHDQVAHLRALPVDVDDRVEVERLEHLAGMGDLAVPRLLRVGDDGRVGDRAVEVEVRVLLGAVEPR